jgi:hypothetical protein
MTVLTLYAAVLSVIGGLLIFASLVLFGTWLVRRLRLPQELPEGIHFAPPAPPIVALVDRAGAVERARHQARLVLIHGRALQANALVQSAQEYVLMARGSAVEATIASALGRMQSAAQAVDKARQADADTADLETARLLGEAQQAFADAETAVRTLPQARRWTFMVLAIATFLLLALWLTAILVLRSHALGAH